MMMFSRVAEQGRCRRCSRYHDNASHRVLNSPLFVKSDLNLKSNNIKVLIFDLIFLSFPSNENMWEHVLTRFAFSEINGLKKKTR